MDNVLESLRKEIDAMDHKIIEALIERFQIVKKVGDYKKENNIPVFDQERETKILQQKIELFQEAGLSQDCIEKLFLLIFQESRSIQTNN